MQPTKKVAPGTSLVAQWLRIHLPMQGTQVRSLVWEDPTCRGATKPVRHNYWACALGPASHNYWARTSQLLSLCAATTEAACCTTREATAMRSPHTATKSSPCLPQLEKARTQQWRPNAAKKRKKKKKVSDTTVNSPHTDSTKIQELNLLAKKHPKMVVMGWNSYVEVQTSIPQNVTLLVDSLFRGNHIKKRSLQGLNFQNIQTAHTIQQQQKNPNRTIGRRPK